MTEVIWKYAFNLAALRDPGQPISLPLPRGACIIAFKMQGNFPTMWYRCQPKNEVEDRVFRLVFTGQEIEVAFAHYGMTEIYPGGLVYHLIEEVKEWKPKKIIGRRLQPQP